MVEASVYVIYSNTPFTREPFRLEVWIQHRSSAYMMLNIPWVVEIRTPDFLSCSLWYHVKKQLNQKFKLMVKIPDYVRLSHDCVCLNEHFKMRTFPKCVRISFTSRIARMVGLVWFTVIMMLLILVLRSIVSVGVKYLNFVIFGCVLQLDLQVESQIKSEPTSVDQHNNNTNNGISEAASSSVTRQVHKTEDASEPESQKRATSQDSLLVLPDLNMVPDEDTAVVMSWGNEVSLKNLVLYSILTIYKVDYWSALWSNVQWLKSLPSRRCNYIRIGDLHGYSLPIW